MTRSITFLRAWMGRGVGQSDSRLNPGVMTMLVDMGVAQWIDSSTEKKSEERRKRKRR